MITPELVERTGDVNTILCHGDFDGIASAAKWIRAGIEPYTGCDHDAWCIDTRLGEPSELGVLMDRALRADHKDPLIKDQILRLLLAGGADEVLRSSLSVLGEETRRLEEGAGSAERYQILNDKIAFIDARASSIDYDRTHLLLCGQRLAQIAVTLDHHSVTLLRPSTVGSIS